jgi:ubiquinone/menaquinone biosynthesis C-methylase UbiE
MPVVGKVRIGPWSEGFFAYWMTEDARVPQITDLSDRRFVSNQYRNAGNLNARIALHQRFSTNPYGWLRWVFDQFQLAPQCRILEIGCGTGDLWRENLDRIPEGWEITLSDFSAGMLDQTGRNLAQAFHAFRYLRIDAQCIPLEGDSFDAVIANHMLYHVPDRNKALAEIQRILKTGGRFYASTNGQRNLRELADLLSKFDANLSAREWQSPETFLLENGAAQLSPWFAQVALRRYEDSLNVTEAAPMVDYLLSGKMETALQNHELLAGFIERELESRGGTIHVTKDSGLFEAIR